MIGFILKGLLGEIFDLSGCQVSIQLNGEGERRKQKVNKDLDAPSEDAWLPIYQQEEAIQGIITLKIKPERTFEHQGIKAEIIGLAKFPQSEEWKQFYLISEELSAPGVLSKALTRVEFKFKGVPNSECIYSSFESSELRVKYLLRVTLGRLLADVHQERKFWIAALPKKEVEEQQTMSKNVEIGIENYIRVDFFLANLHCSISDSINGYILFHMLNLPIRTAQLCLVQKVIRLDTLAQISQWVLKAQQILDGAAVLSIKIPFRMSLLDCAVLGDFAGGGSIEEIGKLWAVKYFVQLVLIDTQERHYFKQHEVNLEYTHKDAPIVEENYKYQTLFSRTIKS